MTETPFWYRVLWVMGMIIFKFLFDLRIEGAEKIPSKGAMIIVANHRSYLDPIVLALVTPRKMNFMAKEELFKNPVFGFLIKKLGAFPLKREKPDRKAYIKALSVLKEGKILSLFPEGTRSISGKIGNLKEGSVRIALHSRVPIFPVVIKGTGEVLPPGKKMIRGGRIKVKVGDPIFTDSFSKEEERQVAKKIIDKIEKTMLDMSVNR